MNVVDFNPSGVTGLPDDSQVPFEQLYSEERLMRKVFYRSDVTGPQGARYELWQESQHRANDIKEAEKYLRENFDVVSIHIIKETR